MSIDWNKFDYKTDMEIDSYDLQKEWEDQSATYMKYITAVANAEKTKNNCHEELKTLRSKLIKKFKEENAKITAIEIEANYRTNKKYIEAKKALIEAEYDHKILDGACFALQMKKVALENMVRLYLSGYYSDPQTPESVDKEFMDKIKKDTAMKKIKEGTNRKKMKRKGKT